MRKNESSGKNDFLIFFRVFFSVIFLCCENKNVQKTINKNYLQLIFCSLQSFLINKKQDFFSLFFVSQCLPFFLFDVIFCVSAQQKNERE